VQPSIPRARAQRYQRKEKGILMERSANHSANQSGPAELDRPIFIVGPHRSGTTLLYGMIGQHPDVGYLNLSNRRFPSSPFFAHFLTKLGVEDMPVEAQKVWDRFRCRDDDVMDSSDAGPNVASWHKKNVNKVLRLRGAKRFLAKYPRLSLRLDWVDSVFPGAIFIYLMRDWRAVVNSTNTRIVKREKRGGGWFGVMIPGWREMGDLPSEVVAGRQYLHVTNVLEGMEKKYPGRFFTVRYADLCSNPVETIRHITDVCDLPWSEAFEASIVGTNLRNSNHKWRTELDASLLERIRDEAPEFFALHEETD
jgi:hypothetical protein